MPGATPTSTSRGAVGGHGVAQAGAQGLEAVHALGRDAVGLGDLHALQRRQVHARHALALLERAEPLQDPVLVVAHDQERHGQVVGGRGPQARDRVLRAALAEHADDLAVGVRELHAERRREAEAQPAAGGEVVGAGREIFIRWRSAGVEVGDSSTTMPSPMSSASVAWTAPAAAACRPRIGGRSGVARAPCAGLADTFDERLSVSAGSARIASPICARAASKGSLVIWTSSAPSGSAGPGCSGSRRRPTSR